MLPHPAKFWIKYYLSKRLHNYETIQGLMVGHGLGGVEHEDLLSIDQALVFPQDFRPTELSHRASQLFLRREGIYHAWHRDPAMDAAIRILGTNRLRQLVETLILSILKPEQAVRKLGQVTGRALPEEVYLRYRHFFWNPTDMSGMDWGRFIQARNAAHKEWLQLAVDARGPGGVQLLLWKTGMSGMRNVEAGRIFADLRNIAYMSALQIAMQAPSVDHAKMLSLYTRSAKTSQDVLSTSAAGVKDIVESFQSFQLRLKEEPPIQMQQLTGGNLSLADDSDGSDDEFDPDY